MEMEKPDRTDKEEKMKTDKAEKPVSEEKKGRKVSVHTAEEKCRAVLSLWTEKRKSVEICRELGVRWDILNKWQERAMEAMLLALQPRIPIEKDVALSRRVAVLLERKSKTVFTKALERRLVRLQGNPPKPREAAREIGA
jgi:transposase-like protein